jgi:hypothetical protein
VKLMLLGSRVGDDPKATYFEFEIGWLLYLGAVASFCV